MLCQPRPGAVPRGCVPVRFLTPTEVEERRRAAPNVPCFRSCSPACATASAPCARCTARARWTSISGLGRARRRRATQPYNLARERVSRKSGRTGQVHPLGGFTGEAEYEGELAEFLPWLRAARWVGVGRQTVWGKGDVRVL